jgi:hypothetical protein
MKLLIIILEHISLRPHLQSCVKSYTRFIKKPWNSYCQINCSGYSEFKSHILKSKENETRLGRWNITQDQDIIDKKVDLANCDNGKRG